MCKRKSRRRNASRGALLRGRSDYVHEKDQPPETAFHPSSRTKTETLVRTSKIPQTSKLSQKYKLETSTEQDGQRRALRVRLVRGCRMIAELDRDVLLRGRRTRGECSLVAPFSLLRFTSTHFTLSTMDGFMNLAKQGYSAYQASQSGHQGDDQSQPYGVQGSSALNFSDNNRPAQGGRKLVSLRSPDVLQTKSDESRVTLRGLCSPSASNTLQLTHHLHHSPNRPQRSRSARRQLVGPGLVALLFGSQLPPEPRR